jgi:hypothetical protein
MKKIIGLIVLIAVCAVAQAQSYTGTADYKKMSRQAIFNEVPFADKVTEAAIQDSLEKLGYKPKESKGFMVYKGVKISSLSNEPLDIYISVERKSKKEKEVSVITMLLARGEDNFVTQGVDPKIIENGKSFLNGFTNHIESYNLEQQIAEMEEVRIANEKKTNSLAGDADDLQKKKKKLEKEIEDNIKEQADHKEATEKHLQNLEALKSKRKN